MIATPPPLWCPTWGSPDFLHKFFRTILHASPSPVCAQVKVDLNGRWLPNSVLTIDKRKRHVREIWHLHGRAVWDERTGLGDHSVKETLKIKVKDHSVKQALKIEVKDTVVNYHKILDWKHVTCLALRRHIKTEGTKTAGGVGKHCHLARVSWNILIMNMSSETRKLNTNETLSKVWIEVYLQSVWYFFVSNRELDVDPKEQGCLGKVGNEENIGSWNLCPPNSCLQNSTYLSKTKKVI